MAVLHNVKLTRKDHLPGTSLQKTGCVFLSFIAHSFLGPQSSDMHSYFKFYLNGNVKLIKIQDQWNVSILFNKINCLVLQWTFNYIYEVLWYIAGGSSVLVRVSPKVSQWLLPPSWGLWPVALEDSLLTWVPAKS